MKIALCTPLHIESAIARVSISVANELTRRGHDVALINIERVPSSTSHTTTQPQFWWKDPSTTHELQGATVILVQIGDNYDYHAGAIQLLHDFRCTGIFHDANIYNLFRMWAFDDRSALEGQREYEQEIRKIYGSESDVDIGDPGQHIRFDMVPWLAAQCAAALVHATFYKQRVQDHCPGPVMVTPLTYDIGPVQVPVAAVEKAALSILTLGHINPNKCCAQVIEAIGRSRLREQAEYRIVGQVSEGERDRLTAIASQFDVRVTISGRVTDEEIASELQRADIVCCLRRPILEGASASAIEAMSFGKPVIVPDGGFYAEIADSAAVKVAADFSLNDIQKALEGLAGGSDLRDAFGKRGKEWVKSNCSVQSYVEKLEQLLAAALLVEPYLGLSSTYARQLSHLGFDQNDPIFFQVADRLQGLCKNVDQD